MTTSVAPPDAGLLAWYDALDEDPPGHRIEVLEGVLIVSPSASREHQERARGLAEVLDLAVQGAGLRAVEDVEWRLEHPVSGLGSRPRPDVSVLDPDDVDGPRPITVEVLSAADHERLVPGQPETRIEGKRRAYAYGGTQVHVEVVARADDVEARWYEAREGTLIEAGSARGDQRLHVGGPFPFSFVPAELEQWLRRRVNELQRRTDAERERADAERERADAERERADRAEAELRRLRGQA